MKINKILKIIFTIFIIVLLGTVLCQTASAEWAPDWSIYDKNVEGNTSKKVTDIMGALINIVSIVCAGIAIITLILIGVEYVMNGAEGKADAKKSLQSYAIGAVILFSASGILKLLQLFISTNL